MFPTSNNNKRELNSDILESVNTECKLTAEAAATKLVKALASFGVGWCGGGVK